MKQKIILAPNFDGTDYLKSLAGLNASNHDTFGVRVMTSIDLARYILQFNGITLNKKFIVDNYLAAMLYYRTKEIEYFASYTFEDVYKLLKSVNELRKCIPYNEKEEIVDKLPKDQFQKKNEAVIDFYNLMMEMLDRNNFIDEISIIRLAIEKGQSIPDFEFVRYEGIILTKLDEALLNKAAGKEVELSKFGSNKPLKISEYLRAFGQDNEVENMLSYIYKNHINFDEVLVVATDVNLYGKILSNYEAAIGLPLVVGNGQPISDTSAGRLFASLNNWKQSHFHLDYLNKIIFSSDFNFAKFSQKVGILGDFAEENERLRLERRECITVERIVETVGNLKLGFIDPEVNNIRLQNYEKLLKQKHNENYRDECVNRDLFILQIIKKINDEFAQGLSHLLEEYTNIDSDNAAVEEYALSKYLVGMVYVDVLGVPLKEIEKYLSGVVVGTRKPKPGHLYLTSINRGVSYLRKHLFVLGLDSKLFPGKCQEDPIIFDRDYEAFGIKNASFRKMEENKNNYHTLIHFANELGVNIHLSYSFYNSQTVKEQSASSVFFETYKEENNHKVATVKDLNDDFSVNREDRFHTVEYFENNLFPLSKVGQTLSAGAKVEPNLVEPTPDKEISSEFLLGHKGLSASAIARYVECPYKFFLADLLGVKQEDETDIYEIIPANELGTLVHNVLECFHLHMTLEEFLEKAKNKFMEYFISHPSDNVPAVANALNDFLAIADNGYMMEQLDHCNEPIRETDLYAIHTPTGLKIHGYPDKVIRLNDGDFKVIDYKTGRTIRHKANDLDSMLQGAHYAYIIEHNKDLAKKLNGVHPTVNEFVFRYLRVGEDISSNDDNHNISDYMSQLDIRLNQIKESLQKSDFPQSGKCESCFFASVCGGKKE